MTPTLPKRNKVIIYSLVLIILAVVSYYFIDRPVTTWTFYNTRNHPWHFIWLYATYLQPLYYNLAPWFILYLISRQALGYNIKSWHYIVVVMIMSMSLTIMLNEQLRFIFGRYWGATWFHGNLSYIENNVYGFTWFKTAHEFKSFPSGHTALTTGLMAALWLQVDNKKIRLFAISNVLAVGLGLILMCYHFVSDVLIGALVGSLSAYFIIYGLKKYNNLKI